jgi:hypothetical protein
VSLALGRRKIMRTFAQWILSLIFGEFAMYLGSGFSIQVIFGVNHVDSSANWGLGFLGYLIAFVPIFFVLHLIGFAISKNCKSKFWFVWSVVPQVLLCIIWMVFLWHSNHMGPMTRS